MIELELRTLLEEHGIENIPDRCVSCTRLGALAADLSKEHDEYASIKVHSDMEFLLNRFVKPMIIESLSQQYPNDTSEEIEARIQERMARLHASGELSEELMDFGALLEDHGNNQDVLIEQIKTLLETCPPEGHTTA